MPDASAQATLPSLPRFNPSSSKGSVISSSASSSTSSCSVSVYRNAEDRFCMAEARRTFYTKATQRNTSRRSNFLNIRTPMRLLVIASTIKDIAPSTEFLARTAIFFPRWWWIWLRSCWGGRGASKKDKSGKAAHLLHLTFPCGQRGIRQALKQGEEEV